MNAAQTINFQINDKSKCSIVDIAIFDASCFETDSNYIHTLNKNGVLVTRDDPVPYCFQQES